jgi:pimeloyl-ACP methyl ester carboxylesterase
VARRDGGAAARAYGPPMRSHRLLIAAAMVALAAAAPSVAGAQAPPTQPCPKIRDARCGSVTVPLDRRMPAGPTLSVGFILLPHSDTSKPPLEPLFVIPGGPGDAASNVVDPARHNFAALRGRRDVVLVDPRGAGRSGAIDCPPLQHLETNTMDPFIAAIGACGTALGDASDRYGAAAVADDIDAIRAAFGAPQIDLYAISYGTVHAQAYALRHADRVRAMILNGAMSPLDTAGSWMLGISNAQAVAANVALVCSRSASCAAGDRHPAASFAELARRLRANPVDGVGRDVAGKAHRLHVDEATLVRIATAVDFAMVNDGELTAAGAALSRGDSAPLLRLAANVDGPLIGDSGPASSFSLGDNAATSCVDWPLPWSFAASFAQRRAQFDAAIARLPFGPFDPATWAANGGFSGGCLQWPAPNDPTPVFTPGARMPDVPVLVFAATLDTQTTLAQNRFVARQFPRGRLVVLRNGGHPPGAFSPCSPRIYTRFVESLDAGDTSCVRSGDADRPAVRAFPRRAGAAPRRVATVAWGAVQDALRQSFRLPDPAKGTGAGLRGGRFDETFDFGRGRQSIVLHGVRFSADVAVDGRVDVAGSALSATLTVASPAGRGTLRLRGRWFTGDRKAGTVRIGGRIGGRRVALATPAG